MWPKASNKIKWSCSCISSITLFILKSKGLTFQCGSFINVLSHVPFSHISWFLLWSISNSIFIHNTFHTKYLGTFPVFIHRKILPPHIFEMHGPFDVFQFPTSKKYSVSRDSISWLMNGDWYAYSALGLQWGMMGTLWQTGKGWHCWEGHSHSTPFS